MTKTEELTPQYLRVANYERFQHYKDRRPVWIKLHLAMLRDYDIKKQKPHVRLTAILLLLVAAEQDNRIPQDHDWLAGELGLSVGSTASAIETLVSIGFLCVARSSHSASKVIAKRSRSASPEKEVEKEKKPPYPPSGKRPKQNLALVDTCPECFCGGGVHTVDCSRRAA